MSEMNAVWDDENPAEHVWWCPCQSCHETHSDRDNQARYARKDDEPAKNEPE